jgi:hypothetical protein
MRGGEIYPGFSPFVPKALSANKLDRSGSGSVEGPVMALKIFLATATAAAIGVGLILPAPHLGRTAFQAPRSQIAQLDVAR